MTKVQGLIIASAFFLTSCGSTNFSGKGGAKNSNQKTKNESDAASSQGNNDVDANSKGGGTNTGGHDAAADGTNGVDSHTGEGQNHADHAHGSGTPDTVDVEAGQNSGIDVIGDHARIQTLTGPDPFPTYEALYDACQTYLGEPNTWMTKTITFPASSGCKNANGGSGFAGFSKSIQVLDLPKDAILCGTEFRSKSNSPFNFKDAYLFTLGNYVITASDSGIINSLPVTGVTQTMVKWDWEKAKATSAQGNNWCLGADLSTCVSPASGGSTFEIVIDHCAAAELSWEIYRSPNALEFNLITMGKTNSSCTHPELTIDFKFGYMPLP
jgi:hypothetical protein